LFNLEGTAVTAVRIAGVSHEFATIPGVEGVLEILMRMKEIVLKSYSSQPDWSITSKRTATVTVAHFDLPSEVEVIDPNQYVATFDGAKLEMEFRSKRKGVSHRWDVTTPRLRLQIDAILCRCKVTTASKMRGDGSIQKRPADIGSLDKWQSNSSRSAFLCANILVIYSTLERYLAGGAEG